MVEINDLIPASPDYNKERLKTLKQLFPDIFNNEGELNINELKKIVDYTSNKELYEFTWNGKSVSKKTAFEPSTATLQYDEVRSVNPKGSDNILIEGENLEVLKLLSSSYSNSVKLVYIDPPYNLDGDRVYSDNYTSTEIPYWEETGQVENGVRVNSNSESDGRFHSKWLSMMYERILLTWKLLKRDGMIFISISDKELANLIKICDDVFGDENKVEIISWRRRHNQPNDKSKPIAKVAEFLVVYAKDFQYLKEQKTYYGLPLTGDFSNPDNDPKGDWASKPWKAGSDQSGSKYKIITPTGIEYNEEWLGNKDLYDDYIEEKRMYFTKQGDGLPRKKYYKFEREEEGQVPHNFWGHEEFGSNQDASNELTDIFGVKNIFSNPKPVNLVAQIIKIATTNNDIVLDFFAGSGSTGHAVLNSNIDDDFNRKFILVQLPEEIKEDEEAYKEGYRLISDVTIDRMKKVINGYKDIPAIENEGFKVYKLTKSKFPRVEFKPDIEKSEEENITLLKEYIKTKEMYMSNMFNKDDIITELAIKNGLKLDYQQEKISKIKENDVFMIYDVDKSALVCVDDVINENIINNLHEYKDLKFICLDRALDTSVKWNLQQVFGKNFNFI